MKAESKTTTRVNVYISNAELVAFVCGSGIPVPEDADIVIYAAPFDVEGDGVILEWDRVHDAEKQG